MEAFQIRNEYPLAKNHKIDLYEPPEELSEDGLYVSENEYWEKYYEHPDFSYEWNNGFLEEKSVTDLDGSQMYQWFFMLLKNFLETNPVAIIMNLEMGFRLSMPSEITIRKPDLAVILNTNTTPIKGTDCTFKGVCDICIESLSHKDRNAVVRDTVLKKAEYEIIGVREYYILDARQEKTAFYRRNKHGNYEKIRPIQQDIIRSEVMPGFQFRLSDLYKQPSLLSMTEDSVYQNFLMPYYQRERLLRSEAEKQLKQERELRDMATERAERMADKLKKLGVSPED